jgi:hypothetical protein
MPLLAQALRCFFPREVPDIVYLNVQTISAAAGATLIALWILRRPRSARTPRRHAAR